MMDAFFPYVAETRGLIVRVSVSHMPDQSEPDRNRWYWAYHIRIENAGALTVQLLTRAWRIKDARGTVHLVEGDGVVGDQPIIHPGQSYDYVSGCPLTTSSGSMVGHYGMIDEEGSRFDIAIPKFALTAPVPAR